MKNRSGGLSRFLGYLLLFVNLATILWLALCYMASVVHPEKIKDIGLFTLTTPYAIAANVIWIILWLFSLRKLRFLFSLIALMACNKLIFQLFAIHFGALQDMSAHENSFKVMSWNVHGLGIYDKPGNKNAEGILERVQKEKPDVLCMLEFEANNKDSVTPFVPKLLRQNHFKEYRFNIDNGLGAYTDVGTCVFTKYPIVKYVCYRLDYGIYLLQCDIQLPGSIMRMYFTHLSSYDLSDLDRATLSEMKQKKLLDRREIYKSRSYIARFNINYIDRAFEADSIARIMRQSPYPTLICGDFNDLPASYVYNTIRGKSLQDAFLQKGFGIGRTYNQIAPTLRIDHIMYDSTALRIIGFNSPSLPYSDHNPVIANFIMK